ncbi:MAG: patatin family protein, partial [Solobacterium sp.]|nr:patatin family protein [Solobacterium sp.]
ASASMPMVSRPVEIDGRKYLDGGAADSIPLLFMETMGYDRNVVILTQPRDFTKQPNSLLPLLRVALKDYPAMVKALENRHIGYNRVRKYIFDQMEKGKLFVIMPPVPLDIGAVEHEADEIKRVYMIGVETGYKCYREVKKFLEE